MQVLMRLARLVEAELRKHKGKDDAYKSSLM